MTPELITQLARDAGMSPPQEIVVNDYWVCSEADLICFAAKVAAHEREMCARVCDGWAEIQVDGAVASMCAADIRARK